MSTEKFRDGDIVRCVRPGPNLDLEGVVVDGTSLGGGFYLRGAAESWNPECFVLLRRPIRVGDVLRIPKGWGDVSLGPTRTISRIENGSIHSREGGAFSSLEYLSKLDQRITHADGTPIDRTEPSVEITKLDGATGSIPKPTCGATLGGWVCNGHPGHTHHHREVANCAIKAQWVEGFQAPPHARFILGNGNMVTGYTAPMDRDFIINGVCCEDCARPLPDGASRGMMKCSGCAAASDAELRKRAVATLDRLRPNRGTLADLREVIEQSIPMTITVEDVCRAVLGDRRSPEVQLDDAARAFFDTDPVVLAFVAANCDAEVRVVGPATLHREGRPTRDTTFTTDGARLERGLGVCWLKDLGGHKTRWVEHAKAAVAREKAQR